MYITGFLSDYLLPQRYAAARVSYLSLSLSRFCGGLIITMLILMCQDFNLGCLAAALSVTAMIPMDAVKTRYCGTSYLVLYLIA